MTTGTFIENARKGLARIAKPDVVFYTLPALMALLVCGTLAQRYIGLYDAQKMFFSSFILWIGPLPLPGGYTLSSVIGISLLCKFIFFTQWSWRKAGTNLAHLGVLVLLIGGLISAWQAQEGFMFIPPGQSSNMISDYHQKELAITHGDLTSIITQDQIRKNKIFTFESTPFTLKILQACRNCKIIRRTKGDKSAHSMAQAVTLQSIPPETDEEANLSGLTIAASGLGDKYDGSYILLDVMPTPIHIGEGKNAFDISYRREQRNLPFSIKLEKFQRRMHPGTSMARSYSSDIMVEDGANPWPVHIEMNKPLRYKGYTFFQSSFAENANSDDTATVLTVVKNKGWLFPYMGTIIVAAGLLLHTFIMTFNRARRA